MGLTYLCTCLASIWCSNADDFQHNTHQLAPVPTAHPARGSYTEYEYTRLSSYLGTCCSLPPNRKRAGRGS